VLDDAGLRSFDEIFAGEARLGHAHDRKIEPTSPHHRLKGRKDLLVSQVSGSSEEDESVGRRFFFAIHLSPSDSPCASCAEFLTMVMPRCPQRHSVASFA
jgi:hypothetical protein